MRFSVCNKKGFYTLETVIILPLVILAIISVGYFIRLDSVWENIMSSAIDESSYSSSRSYGSITQLDSLPKIKKRVLNENDLVVSLKFSGIADRYSDNVSDELTKYTIRADMAIRLPAGFDRHLDFDGRIKYRSFRGKKYAPAGMGDEGLESDVPNDPVWIFPQSGIRYHAETCTYVQAAVRPYTLTSSLKKRYSACEICGSGDLPLGSTVYCFKSEDTAYHRGSCRCINRHTAVIDRSEAEDKGYTPCTKCGGN